MAQKANTNSYNLQLKNLNNKFNAFDSALNYSFLEFNTSTLKHNIITLFERHGILVKNCFFVYSSSYSCVETF
jgi:hypothetical protein